MSHALTGGNFHTSARIGIDINPASWMLESNPLLAPGAWAPAGETRSSAPHPDATGDALLWDLWVPGGVPADFFRISFDPDYIEP